MYINFAWFDNFFVDFLVELIASKLVLRINIELEIHNLVCILKIVESYSVLSVLFDESSKIGHKVILSFQKNDKILKLWVRSQFIIVTFPSVVLDDSFEKSEHFIIKTTFKCNFHLDQ